MGKARANGWTTAHNFGAHCSGPVECIFLAMSNTVGAPLATYGTIIMKTTLAHGPRWVMGLLYAVAGVNHFVNPGFYTGIMPPYLPWPMGLIFVSGVAEVLLGVGVCFTRTQRGAAWLIVAMLMAFLPVHLHMLLHAERFDGVPVWALWARILFQGVLVYWAWRYTRPARVT